MINFVFCPAVAQFGQSTPATTVLKKYNIKQITKYKSGINGQIGFGSLLIWFCYCSMGIGEVSLSIIN
jgi:hypothetical protein